MKYTNNTIKMNFTFIICIVFIFAIFMAKMIYIGLSRNVEGTDLTELAASRTTVKETINSERGTIYDKSGNALAQNVNSYTVIAYLSEKRTTDDRYPKHVVDKEATARALSEVLLPLNGAMTYEYILTLLSQTGKYQVELGPGGKNISELIKQKIEELDLPGIDFTKTSKRYYPYGDFASYIIGYAKKYDGSDELIGELGIEEYCNRYLSGSDGEIVYQKDRYGYKLADRITYTTKEVQNGYDVYLTLDSQIQIFLDNAVQEFKNYDPSWVTITIADANTGAIVGSSTTPSFNPNILNITNYNNPLVSFTYEPGSTMKIFSFMSAIEEGAYEGESLYKSGQLTIDEYTIKDWNKTGWGNITYDTGFTYSSNIAAANLARAIGKKKLLSYYEKLGFGAQTGIELANEYYGNIDIQYETELATASYGQGVTVTPIQMIQALTSITNDGTTMRPYIIDKIEDSVTKEVVYEGGKTEVNKVYSTSTVNKIKELMDRTVNGEDTGVTGKVYKTDAVRLIGKTGTSYYVDESGKYATGTYKNIRSFAGVFPKEEPEYIIYVAVKDFHGTSKNMGAIVRSLVESISKYKNIDNRVSDKDDSKIVTVPKLVNKTVIKANETLNSLGVQIVTIGDGSTVIKQYPETDSKISKNSKVYLVTNGSNVVMPDMYGWSSKEVTDFCTLANITCQIEGYGYVASQNIPAGQVLTDIDIINPALQSRTPAALTDGGE